VQKPFATHEAQLALESVQVLPPLPEQRLQVLGHFCVIKVIYDALLHNAAFAAQFVATSAHEPPGEVVVAPPAGQKRHVFWQLALMYVLKLISLQSDRISLHPVLTSLQPLPETQSPQVPLQYCDMTVVQLGSLQYRIFAVQLIGDNGSSPHVYAAVSQQSLHVLAQSNAMLSKSGLIHVAGRAGAGAAASGPKIALHSVESLTSEHDVALGENATRFNMHEVAVIALQYSTEPYTTMIVKITADQFIILLPKIKFVKINS
jgi:hypothetical protein